MFGVGKVGDEIKNREKENIFRRFKRLYPGGSDSLGRISKDQREIVTSGAQMAEALTQHWRKVFQNTDIDESLLKDWLEAEYPPVGDWEKRIAEGGRQKWKVTKQDIKKAIARTGASAAGPDGIPYKAWRAIGKTGMRYLRG